MPPELHMHPDRLLTHATAASGLSEELHAALRDASVDGPRLDEQQRLLGVVGVAVRELAELSAALGGVAAAATAAEKDVAAALTRCRETLGQERP